MKTRLVSAVLGTVAILALVLGIGTARADMASATVLANTCFSCHGSEGASVGAMPSIKGKPADFIMSQLMAFRAGKREATVMTRITKGFTADEIQALARYFAGQK